MRFCRFAAFSLLVACTSDEAVPRAADASPDVSGDTSPDARPVVAQDTLPPDVSDGPDGDLSPETPNTADTSICPPALVASIATCASSSFDSDPEASGYAMYAACASPERMKAARETYCAASDDAVCALDESTYLSDTVPRCAHAAVDAWLDGACVFGARYRDLAGRAEAIVVLARRTFDGPTDLTALEASQILEAVKSTAYDDLTRIDEVFDVVDEGLVHQTLLWDASHRAPYVAYEVGAGDNSFGAVFPLATATTVATINDGDFYGCKVTWGPERRRCLGDADCEVGTCRGLGAHGGRCIDARADDHPLRGQSCGSSTPESCPAEAGLLCAGAALDGDGLCTPAWMRGVFFPDVPSPADLPDEGALDLPIEVFGLASVDTDVRLSLLLTHPDFSELEVRLEHASGTSVVIFDGALAPAPPYGELSLRDAPVSGFPGDEHVNGTWHLRVTDRTAGGLGVLHGASLEVTSRWD